MSEHRSDQLQLRPATSDDAGLLLGWRNAPSTRAASRNTKEIGTGEHADWLRAVIDDPERHLMIAERDSEPVGQVRFDRLGDGDYEISVSVDPDRRGGGLGAALVSAGLEWLWRNVADAARVVAMVRRGNDASLRTFEAAGFTPAESDDPDFARLEARPPSS